MKQLVILLVLFALAFSCAKEDESSLGGGASYNYAGPGSNWTATISGSSFTITESDAGLTVNGSVETLSSGFKKLTVSSASGSGAPSSGDQAYGLDVPGVVFLLKPLEANSEIIPMVASGSCPTATTNMNWIVTKMDSDADADDPGQDALGTATFSGTTASLPFQYSLTGATVGTNISLGTFSCSNGKATVSGAEMYLTQAGGAIVRTGYDTPSDDTDDGIILAMPGQSISSGDADGNYAGLVFTTGDTYPVKATVSASSISVQQIDPDTGSDAGSISDTVNISAFNSPNTGFISGSLNSDSNKKVMCNVNTNLVGTGKSIIFCSGMDSTGGANDDLFAVLLISK